jgi:hypothetical protein
LHKEMCGGLVYESIIISFRLWSASKLLLLLPLLIMQRTGSGLELFAAGFVDQIMMWMVPVHAICATVSSPSTSTAHRLLSSSCLFLSFVAQVGQPSWLGLHNSESFFLFG